MCAPSPPPPPDYSAAAAAQGAANKEAAIASAQLSNPNIKNAYGSQTVTYANDPNTGNPVPTVTQTLSPEQQRIFNLNQQGQEGLATVGRDAVNRVGGILGQDVNFDRDVGTQAQGRQEVIDAMMSRYDTDLGRRRDTTESDLIARGIPRGSEAWNREMEMLDRGRTDALQQAIVGADARAMDERRQGITELLAQRQTPINEISALRSGSQVAPLQFQGYQGQGVGAAPVFNAANLNSQYGTDVYNAQNAARANTTSGLFTLGAAALMSDRRVKRDVLRIGTHALGIGLYVFRYLWDSTLRYGVMADEVESVMPEAVITLPNGLKAVNYAMVGL